MNACPQKGQFLSLEALRSRWVALWESGVEAFESGGSRDSDSAMSFVFIAGSRVVWRGLNGQCDSEVLGTGEGHRVTAPGWFSSGSDGVVLPSTAFNRYSGPVGEDMFILAHMCKPSDADSRRQSVAERRSTLSAVPLCISPEGWGRLGRLRYMNADRPRTAASQ